MSFATKTIGHCLSARSSTYTLWLIASSSSLSVSIEMVCCSFDLAERSRKCNVHENWCSYLLGRLDGWWSDGARVRQLWMPVPIYNFKSSVADSLIFTRRNEYPFRSYAHSYRTYTLNYTLSSKTQFILDKKSHRAAHTHIHSCI